jgi:hypothetical protein
MRKIDNENVRFMRRCPEKKGEYRNNRPNSKPKNQPPPA